MRVDINLIDLVSNVRGLEPQPDPSLVSSVAVYGLIQPITVLDTGDGRYRILDGHRRYAAAKEAGFDTIKIDINDGDFGEGEIVGAQVNANTLREDMTAWQLAQAALSLKDIKVSVKDSALLLGISQSELSKLRKISRMDLPSGADQLSMEALTELSEFDENERDGFHGDVVNQVLDGSRNMSQAIRSADVDWRRAEIIDEMGPMLREYAESGVEMTVSDPRLTDKLNAYGQAKLDRNVKQVRELGFEEEDHIGLGCHIVWTFMPDDGWSMPKTTHWCLNARLHETKGKSELKRPDALSDDERKAKASVSRREVKDAKQLRRDQAAVWMSKLGSTTVQRDLAVHVAVTTWREDHTRAAIAMLGFTKERVTGASYSWYSDRLGTYLDERFGDDEGKRDAWKVRFLNAYKFIDAYWPVVSVKEEIEAIEVPDESS